MTVKLKLIYLICMILCVFITFSTVSAADLNVDFINDDSNQAAPISQSESSITNLNENNDNLGIYSEDKDCVDSMNGLSNSNTENSIDDNIYSISDLDSINSDEKSLKSSLSSINSNGMSSNLDSSNGESNDEVLKASSSSFEDLQILIDNARVGDTINLEGKTFYGNGTQISINKAITINGGSSSNMATLDGKGLSFIFFIKSNDVHLSNCNFINALGNAVYLNGNDTSISSCNFWNNSASLYVSPAGVGFLLENSNFTDGIYKDGSNVFVRANKSTVRNCNFINNTVENNEGLQGYGGALQIGCSDNQTNEGYVINCNFINNTVITNANDTHAGALCFRPGIKVSNSNFINNYCNRIGGATTLHSDGELFNCTFINNRAGEYGGAISTGFNGDYISVNITNCSFINNSAPMGGAIQIKGHNVKVTNSIFKENKANESEGGAVFIMGNDALIINSTFQNNFAKTVGAGILINGSDVSVLNSSFNNNIADYGSAVYIIGSNANLFSSNFTNHNVKNGSVYIKGINAYVYDSIFEKNLGESGAGLYVEGLNTTLILSNFSNNNVTAKGGAIYINGSNAQLILSNFLNNNAIPNILDVDSGLGGAVYIKGDNNAIDSSIFNYNTARNGSAIYTDGLNMSLSNTNFDRNQAWSYILASSVNPSLSYFNESDILIDLTLIGGNNIANAIYNTASMDEIYFYNISYVSSKGPKYTGLEELHPVDGAENSNDGSLLYQDDREDNQLVNVVIYKDSQDNGEGIYGLSSNAIGDESISNNDIILNKTFITGILGDISFNLSDYIDGPLEKGKYILYAKHFEDDYYKEIDGNNKFEIVPIVDLAISIGSSRVNVDFNKTVKYTIKVSNNGPNNASGVNVSALIPEGLVYLSSTPSIGTYDIGTGIWDIGSLDIGENQTLIINAKSNQTGIIDFPVNVSAIEDDSNPSNNFNNKTIRVLMSDLAIEIKASEDTVSYGDIINWTVTVKNNGPNNASKAIVSLDSFDSDLIYLNCSDDSFNQTSLTWEINSLLVDEEISFVISTKANSSNDEIMLNANVSSDTYDPIESNNLDSDLVNVLPLCDLITKVNVSENPANKDDIVEWILTVSNDGPDDASNVILSLSDLDSLGTFLDSSETFDKENLIWIIGDLSSGDNVSLSITTKIEDSNKTIILEGNASCDTLELNHDNNYDFDSLSINPICDLAITIIPDKNPTSVGEIVNWIINVTNNGPDNASDVNVFNDFPEALEYVIHESDKGELEKKTDENGNITGLVWKIGDLKSNESALLIISTEAFEEGSVVNNVSARSLTLDINESNNLDSAVIDVVPLEEPENPDQNDTQEDSNNSEDNLDDDVDEEYPWYDYDFLDDYGNDEGLDDENDRDQLENKSCDFLVKKFNHPIDISSKKTGNPFIWLIISIFALFTFQFRKN